MTKSSRAYSVPYRRKLSSSASPECGRAAVSAKNTDEVKTLLGQFLGNGWRVGHPRPLSAAEAAELSLRPGEVRDISS